MASKKGQSATSHRYLIINLNTFLKSYPLQTLTFNEDKDMQKQLNKLMYNSYAVHENHPNISLITIIAMTGGAYWHKLSGDKQLVRPLI
jgi:hypothetical protein